MHGALAANRKREAFVSLHCHSFCKQSIHCRLDGSMCQGAAATSSLGQFIKRCVYVLPEHNNGSSVMRTHVCATEKNKPSCPEMWRGETPGWSATVFLQSNCFNFVFLYCLCKHGRPSCSPLTLAFLLFLNAHTPDQNCTLTHMCWMIRPLAYF